MPEFTYFLKKNSEIVLLTAAILLSGLSLGITCLYQPPAYAHTLTQHIPLLHDWASFQCVQLLISLSLMGSLFGIYGWLRKTHQRQQWLFAEIDQINRSLIFHPGDTPSGRSPDAAVVQELFTSLQKAKAFIEHIEKGHYQESFAGITPANRAMNQTNLAGALLRMRDTLQQVAAEEAARNWTTQGIAIFSQTLRTTSTDLTQLSEVILSQLVNYMQANQGALFIQPEQEPDCLEQAACYAYGRQKYGKQKVMIGEGLLGQVMREKDTIFLTEVPDNYPRITSGLGQASPWSILIVPLQTNGQLYGALELASFRTFTAHQIAFVEKLSESIALTMATVRNAQQTRQLLEESQQQTEIMRAQEEEMRQNMEELEASQEETLRNSKRMEGLLEESRKREFLLQEQEAMMRASMEELASLQQALYQKDQQQKQEIERLQQSFTDKEAQLGEIMQEMRINEEDLQQNEARYREAVLGMQQQALKLQAKEALIAQLQQQLRDRR